MSFQMLGPDEYLVIYKHALHWPAFYRTCRSLYTWAREYRRREVAAGVKSTFMLSKFSDHVRDWDSYCKAVLITPPIHTNRDMMSTRLIKRLVTEGGQEASKVLVDMKEEIGMWILDAKLFFSAYMGYDVQYWMFAAYEACIAGNGTVVKHCMDMAQGNRACQESLELLSLVWNAHNSKANQTPGVKNTIRLAFNDCIYKCLLHNDHVGIGAVIQHYDVDLEQRNFYSRDDIKAVAKRDGYESCKKVLDENNFF